VFTDADGKTTHLVDQFSVSEDFDTGESVFYPAPVFPGFDDPNKLLTFVQEAYQKPGRKFAEWTVRRDLGWPTAYLASIAMAEKDDGGFWKFLQELLNRVVEEVEKTLKMGIGAAVGGVIGAKLGGVWGAIIGAVVGFIVGAIIDLLTAENADDILGSPPVILSLGAATKSYYEWTGLLKQPHPDTFPITYKHDGGHYRVWCYYQLY
jgi:Glycine zipper